MQPKNRQDVQKPHFLQKVPGVNGLNTTFCKMKWLPLISMCLLSYIHWFVYTLLWGQWRGASCIRIKDTNCSWLSFKLDFLFLVSHTNFFATAFYAWKSYKINSSDQDSAVNKFWSRRPLFECWRREFPRGLKILKFRCLEMLFSTFSRQYLGLKNNRN